MFTTQKVIFRAYAILGNFLTQEELYYEDARDELTSLCAGYVQDQDTAGRDRRTAVAEVDIVPADIDFDLSVPNVPDYEAAGLEYRAFDDTNERGWAQANLVPYAAFNAHAGGRAVVASTYGSYATPDGQKLKLNLTAEEASRLDWRLSYRLPLLAELQMGDRPPLPENFCPMVELDLAVACVGVVRSSRKEWADWVRDRLPLQLARLREWRNPEGTGRWQKYLESSEEDAVQPRRYSDQFRRTGGRRSTRGYVPRG